jgi:hypothetical protein
MLAKAMQSTKINSGHSLIYKRIFNLRKNMVQRVVETILQINTNWTEKDVIQEALKIGLKHEKSVGHRRTFQDSSGQRYSVYLNGNGGVLFAEATLDIIFDAEELSQEEYENSIKMLTSKLDNIAATIVPQLGNFKLYDIASNDALPFERDSLKLFRWDLKTYSLLLELKHESRELPIRIALALVPSQYGAL